jgi:hypothetical protein
VTDSLKKLRANASSVVSAMDESLSPIAHTLTLKILQLHHFVVPDYLPCFYKKSV